MELEQIIKKIEENHGITLPKPDEYWYKEDKNQKGWPNNYYYSISLIKEIVIRPDAEETIQFCCDRVKTSVYGGLTHHEDTWGQEEVVYWLTQKMLKKTDQKTFAKWVEKAESSKESA